MDKYVIAPPSGSTNNSVGAADRPWKEGHFEKLPNWQEYLAESTGYGIVSGCEPTISGLTVTVGAGIVHLADGTRKEIAQTNVTLDSADPTNPRIDIVYITSTGEVAKVTGTAAASPSAPALPSNGINVAQVSVAAGASAGTVNRVQTIAPNLANYGVVNVKDFGAKGDGVTDDTAAIQAAIDNGHIIIIPNGAYKILNDIKIRSNKKIIIEGTLFLEDVSLAFFDVDNPVYEYNGVTNVVIEGHGAIDCNGLAHHNSATPIRIYHAKDILIKDITIKNYYKYHAIEIGSSNNIEIRNIRIPNFYPDGGSDEAIQIEISVDSGGQWGGAYYDSTPTRGVRITGCRIGTNGGGIINAVGIHGVSQERIDYYDIEITDNIFITNGSAILFLYPTQNVIIKNNKFKPDGSGTGGGIDIRGGNLLIIENNIFENLYETAIFTLNENSIINNNVFRSCGQNGTSPWVLTYTNIKGFIITNNTAIIDTGNETDIIYHIPSDYVSGSSAVFVNNVVKGLDLFSAGKKFNCVANIERLKNMTNAGTDLKVW